jgi:hypothetical protein
MAVQEEAVVVGQSYRLPAGHAWLQPEMVVTVVQTKPREWVAYQNETNNGCSRMDYFCDNAEKVG